MPADRGRYLWWIRRKWCIRIVYACRVYLPHICAPVQHSSARPIQPVLLEAFAIVSFEHLGQSRENTIRNRLSFVFHECMALTLNILIIYAVLGVWDFLKWPTSFWASTKGGRQMAATSLYKSSVCAAEYLPKFTNGYFQKGSTLQTHFFLSLSPTANSSAQTWTTMNSACSYRNDSDPFASCSAHNTR